MAGGPARNLQVLQPTRLPLQLFELFVHFGEGVDGEFQVFARMRSGDLCADRPSRPCRGFPTRSILDSAQPKGSE